MGCGRKPPVQHPGSPGNGEYLLADLVETPGAGVFGQVAHPRVVRHPVIAAAGNHGERDVMKRRVLDDHAGCTVGVHAHHEIRCARFVQRECALGVRDVQAPVPAIEGEDVGTPRGQRLVQLAHATGDVEHPACVEALDQELRENGEAPEISHPLDHANTGVILAISGDPALPFSRESLYQVQVPFDRIAIETEECYGDQRALVCRKDHAAARDLETLMIVKWSDTRISVWQSYPFVR